jgi:hypothetical protein
MVNCKSSIEDKKKMGLRVPQPPFLFNPLTEVLEGNTY